MTIGTEDLAKALPDCVIERMTYPGAWFLRTSLRIPENDFIRVRIVEKLGFFSILDVTDGWCLDDMSSKAAEDIARSHRIAYRQGVFQLNDVPLDDLADAVDRVARAVDAYREHRAVASGK